MMRLDAYLLLISCDNDLVTAVLDLTSSSFPFLNVDVIDTLGAGLRELRSNAYDLCILDFSNPALPWQNTLRAIARQDSSAGSIVLLADEVYGRDGTTSCDGIDCIPRSRADAWTLERSIGHALERRLLTATIDRLRRQTRRNDASPSPRPPALAALEGIPLLFERAGTNGDATNGYGHGIATADDAGKNGHHRVTDDHGTTGGSVDHDGIASGADDRVVRNASGRDEPAMSLRNGSGRRGRRSIPARKPEGTGSAAGNAADATQMLPDRALLDAIMGTSPSPIAVLDDVGNIVTINHALETQIGYTAEELRGAPAWHLAVEDEREIVLERFGALLNGRSIEVIETHLTSKSGQQRLVAWSATTIRGRDGNVTNIVACGTDLTDQRAAEQLLRQSEERFRVLIEQGQDDVTIATADGVVIYASPSATHVTGYAPDDVVGTSVFDRVHPEDAPRLRERFREMLTKAESLQVTYRYVHKDGRIVHLESIGTSLLDDPVIRGVIINTRDVSEHVRVERELAAAVADLRISELKYQHLVAHAYDSITVLGIDGSVLFESPNIERLLGYTPAEAASMNAFDFIHPDEIADLTATFAVFAAQPGAVLTQTNRCRHKDGTWRYLETTSTNLIDDPVIGGIVMNSRDVTDRFLAEQERAEAVAALRESERHFRCLIENARDIIAIYDADGINTYHSPSVERALGYRPEELLGTTPLMLAHPDDYDRVAARLAAIVADRNGTFTDVARLRHKDGTWRYVETTGSNLLDEPSIRGIVINARDVTERVMAEREREELLALVNVERDRLNKMMRAIPGMIWESRNVPGSFEQETVFVNDYVEKLYGYSISEWTGTPNFWLQTIHPEDVAKMRQHSQDFSSQNEIHMVHRAVRKDGRAIWADVRLIITRDEAGRPTGTVGFAFDVTDRIKAEQALRRSERRYRSLVTATAQIVWGTDASGIGRAESLHWSDSEERGPAAEADGPRTTWLESVHPDDLPEVVSAWQESLMHCRRYEGEYRLRTEDGNYRLVHARAVPVLDDDGRVLEWIGTCTDITDRKLAEEALRRSEEYFRLITENSLDLVSILETDGTVRYVSPSYERALGWEPGERIGGDTFSVIHPDDAGMIAQRFREMLRAPGNTTKAELRLRHKDGTWKLFESFAKNLTGEPAVGGIIVSSRDITERKRAELELQDAHDRLEARVAERTAEIVEMMERLEESYANQKRFVADASHDLRTPLTALRAELDLILQREEIEEGLRGALVRITSQARRLDQLTNDLLVLATLDSNQKLNQVEHVRIDDLVIESICNLSTFAAEKSVSWNIQFDDAIEVTCDMTSIRRALFNVLENATKYSRPDTVIDVMLRQTDDMAIVEVTDHGVGVPDEDLPRVFERFYRGDRMRSTHGTGLGLAIVKAVLEAHGGSVTMTSSVDEGTTVRIELPRGTSGATAA
jgi:PAS domain S-box-containing protein